MPKKPDPPTYTQRLIEELAVIETDSTTVMEASQIRYGSWNATSVCGG